MASAVDFDRLRDFDSAGSSYRLPSRTFIRDEYRRHGNERREKLPYIVLKDPSGRRLDTYTQFQETIYRARQNIRQTREALNADEWRLPHAPPPARPDYSRAPPPITKTRERMRGDIHQLSKSTRTPATRIVEVDVDDVAFVAQSLHHLPNMPSLSFLRQEIMSGPKNYFQIVQTMLLHKRFMKQTDKRDAIYNFPGFCSGCRRAGLCYGCEQSMIPHYHHDRLMKTGGGFTYYKKNKPEQLFPARNPLNWKLQFPELALKSVMEAHEKGELGTLSEDAELIDHDENCLIKSLIEDKVALPDININKSGMMKTSLTGSRESDDRYDDEGIVADGKSLDDKLSKNYRRSARMSGTSGQGSDQSGEGYPGDSYNGFEHEQFQKGGSRISHTLDLRQPVNDEDQFSYDEHEMAERMGRTSVGFTESAEQDEDQDIEQSEGMDTNSGEGNEQYQDFNSNEENQEGIGAHVSRSRKRSSSSGSRHGKGRQQLTGQGKRDGSVTTKSSSPYSRKYDRLYQGKAYSPDKTSPSGSPSSSKRRLYKAPPAFKLKKSNRKKIQASSPFSSKRDYNLDLNKKFEVKKSDRKATQFQEFERKGGDWKAPPKFELKDNEKKDMKFWKPPKKKDQDMNKKRRPRRTAGSPDSGLDSEKIQDSGNDGKDRVAEMDERVLTPSSQRISTPPEKPKRVIQKKQFVRREVERKPPTPIARSCTPQTPLPEEKEPETAIETPEIEEDTTPIKLPEIIRLDTPPLPEIEERKWESTKKGPNKTAILPVPKLKEAPKSPTQKKKRPTMPRSTHKRRSKQPAEAPVTKEEVRQMQDPLDFLAKYCIVNKDRLPFYERIYSNIIEGQPMKYERQPILSPRTGMPISKDDSSSHEVRWEAHQLNMFHDLVTISRGRDVTQPGMNVPEQYVEKLAYTLEILDKKQRQITEDLHVLQSKKLSQVAEMAKQMIPEITRVNYQPKVSKKGKKKKKKKKKGKATDDFDDDDDDELPQVPLRAEDITDQVIAMRLDESTFKKICKKGEIPQIELEMQRCGEKLAGIDDRLMELEGEKNLLGLYCMEVFFNEQNDNRQPIEFRRQQSALFRHLHPDPDIEMNIEELEGALQVVNHNLISESEFDYLYQILNLPGRRKINFQLFTIIAALSEKISQMDPVIKKLLIKDNVEETKKKRTSYEALDLKMETSKELFALLADGDYETNNNGNAKASQLAVELAAGGLDPEHVGYVLSKFNRFGTGYIDFLDFVTYVPLFIEIHQKIVDDPFNVSLDV